MRKLSQRHLVTVSRQCRNTATRFAGTRYTPCCHIDTRPAIIASNAVLIPTRARPRFLDKTGYTGSRAQWVNGVVLLSTFFSVRIVYGWYLSAAFMRALFAARAELSDLYLVVFCLGNLTLNALNLIWCVAPRCGVRVERARADSPVLRADSLVLRAAP